MNRFAYLTTGNTIKILTDISRAKFRIHDRNKIPKDGSLLFVINHFTRIETLFLPYFIFHLTQEKPVWSLADYGLFKGSLGDFLEKVGAVSTKNPDRDKLIVKSLLTGETSWIIFPEGMMVKNKKIFEKGKFVMTLDDGQKRPPHTGAATIALRTEFYRQRLRCMSEWNPDEAKRLLGMFEIDSIDPVIANKTYIVPVNITYYPIRAKENTISKLMLQFMENLSDRMIEELMTEGNMLISGVDIDIRFGDPINIEDYMDKQTICQDISAKQSINFDDVIPSITDMKNASSQIMNQYMTSIYDMTTVNHDHIIASILRLYPFNKIQDFDLRRKVYMATLLASQQNQLFLHESITQNQINILTDDHFNKYKQCIEVAIEKEIIKKTGDTLIKDRDLLYSAIGFHSVRIDNPIEVIANEVEPLSVLQKIIYRIAWEPVWLQRKRIRKMILAKTIEDFEKDYETYYISGETKGKEIGMPYLLKGKLNKKIGIILIHGYMAAPFEVKGLAEYLANLGYWVHAPRLKGHGTSPDDLVKRTRKDWMDSVDESYAILKNICHRVIAGGFSFGAGLALDISARVSDMAGVFAICPPRRLHDVSAKLVPAVNVWNKLVKKVHWESASKEFIENTPEHPHINYFRNPIAGIRELERLMNDLDDKLPQIKCPALILQADGDPVVNPKGSRQIYEQLGSDIKEYRLMNYNKHGILLGKGSTRVYSAIGDFVQRVVTKKS